MPVRVLAGPPCSGKTTLATSLAKPRDLVLDFDAICCELDGRPGWDHAPEVRSRAAEVFRVRLAHAAHHPGYVYVIRSAASAAQRVSLARQLWAQVWLLDPGRDECERRARRDQRPSYTFAGIADWYAHFQPAAVDQPAPGGGCPP